MRFDPYHPWQMWFVSENNPTMAHLIHEPVEGAFPIGYFTVTGTVKVARGVMHKKQFEHGPLFPPTCPAAHASSGNPRWATSTA